MSRRATAPCVLLCLTMAVPALRAFQWSRCLGRPMRTAWRCHKHHHAALQWRALCSKSSDDPGAASSPRAKRGRGPVKRDKNRSNDEEDMYQSMADAPAPSVSASPAARARAVKQTRGQTERKKEKPALQVDSNWQPPKSGRPKKQEQQSGAKGRKSSTRQAENEDFDFNVSGLRLVEVGPGESLEGGMKAVASDLTDVGSDDEEDVEDELAELGTQRLVEEEEDDDGWEEFEKAQASRGEMSMADRLQLAQKGSLFNPYVANMGKSKADPIAREEGDDDDMLLSSNDPVNGPELEREAQPVKYAYKIVLDAGTCPGCGNAFQTKNEGAPGYLPADKFDQLQAKLMMARKPKGGEGGRGKKGEQEKARELFDMSPEEEMEMLLGGSDEPVSRVEPVGDVAEKPGVPEEPDVDTDEEDKLVICQRCHRLKHYGQVEDSLRPGWSEHELLTPERFRELVSVVRKKRCAVVCLVDIFDFHGSLLYNLPRIVGDNPVLMAVNKVDLLPTDISQERIRIWVKQELDKIGMRDVGTRDVYLISCKTGAGVKPLLNQLKVLARQRKRDLYVVGAANVGKSTFINRLIEVGKTGGSKPKGKKKKDSGKEMNKDTLVTTSALPGTTLNFIEIDLGDKVSLYDTPGLILPHQITTALTTEELRAVIPQKRVNHVTLRLAEGKSVLIGGLVRLDMVEGRPFLFTFYASNEIKLHQTATDRADEFLQKHIGDLIYPPYSLERLQAIGPMVAHDFDIEGEGWKTSSVDIVISGLGWVSVTGALNCKVRIMAPGSVGVRLRPPLLPYETWSTTAKYTGLRAVKKDKQKGGSR